MLLRSIQILRHLIIGVGLLLLVSACATVENNHKITARETTEETKETKETEQGASSERPVVIDLAGRIDFNETMYRKLLKTLPDKGAPVFFTAVPRMAERENEYRMGLMLLARQAALYKRASVTAKFMTQSNNRDMGYREQIDVEVDKELLKSMADKVEITTHYRDAEGSYFRGVLKGESLPRFQVSTHLQHDIPVWVSDLPSYEGYITAVGTAQRHRFIAESFLQSDRQALAALAKQRDIEVKQKRDDLEVEYQGSAYQQLNLEITDTTVQGFYVIDRWVSEDGNTYYSLAVCPK